MSELPAYYHLSRSQIDRLSFLVTLRCVRNGRIPTGTETNAVTNEQFELSKKITWQEKITKPPEAGHGACVFAYTHAEVIPYEGKPSNNNKDAAQEKHIHRGFSFRKEDAKLSRTAEFNDRLHREDPCQIMVIMAAIGSSNNYHEEVLCVMKLYPRSQCLSACPAWSEAEPEDCDSSQVFISERGVDEIITQGPRITTYVFSTAAGSVYEYTIEWNRDEEGCSDEAEIIVAEQNSMDRQVNDERRERIGKEYDTFDCMHEKDANWDNQAQIEIVSADGFSGSNLLLCAPHGSGIAIRYRVLKPSGKPKEEEVILKGITASVQTYSKVRGSLEFVTHFVVAFIGITFAIMLSLGNSGSVFSRIILQSIVPLVLIIKAGVLGDGTQYHINHQFSLLYNSHNESEHEGDDISNSVKPKTNLVLELHAYLKQNFDVTSLAGCGTITIPSEPGTYDIRVPTWKPIACSGLSENRCRMYDFYLGSCLTEIRPLDSVPTSENESEMTKDTDVELFSKGGLLTDGSGSINVRVNVMQNFFNNGEYHADGNMHSTEESRLQRVKMRETVDEVLSRVRRNKRGRMARVYNSSEPSAKWRKEDSGTSMPSEKMKEKKVHDKKLPTRTAEVLERVRSRKILANKGKF